MWKVCCYLHVKDVCGNLIFKLQFYTLLQLSKFKNICPCNRYGHMCINLNTHGIGSLRYSLQNSESLLASKEENLGVDIYIIFTKC